MSTYDKPQDYDMVVDLDHLFGLWQPLYCDQQISTLCSTMFNNPTLADRASVRSWSNTVPQGGSAASLLRRSKCLQNVKWICCQTWCYNASDFIFRHWTVWQRMAVLWVRSTKGSRNVTPTATEAQMIQRSGKLCLANLALRAAICSCSSYMSYC